ncbi:MAG: sensor domain-containing diguanylate cyclase [Vallitaleaceae bacterium]|jgi:diguanylate cyclase (GGDEF)-like protein|nr:sensor domain-containing diguanylate cyclase [Vallitaleaceae bacterium]
MDHTNLLTTILKAFSLDTQNNTLSFLSTFLDQLLADDDSVDVGYIALVNHDLWSIHASRGIDFTNTDLQGLRTSDQSSSIIDIQSLTNPVDKVFPYDKASSNAYITDSIADFYELFDIDSKNRMIETHQMWSSFAVIPFYLNELLLGHMILCFKSDVPKTAIQNLIQDLKTSVDLIAVCLRALNKDRYAEDLDAIVSTSISIASTHRLTGHIHASFLSTLFKLALKLITEADYGSSVFINNGLWLFDDAVGHDIEALKSIPITKDIYEKNMLKLAGGYEVDKDVFIIQDILNNEHYQDKTDPQNTMILSKIAVASRPIKSSMQVVIKNGGQLRGVIILDISPSNPRSFTNKSIKLLKKIGQVASMFFSYNTLYGYTESFTQMTELISRFMSSANQKDSQFINDFLKLMVRSIPEANYASIYLVKGGSIRYIDAIGHNIKVLKNLELKESYYRESSFNHDVPNGIIPFSIFSDIQNYSTNKMPDSIREQYIDAVKPVKETMICHYRLNDETIVNIALDISKESLLTYSNESIKMFQSFSNIGFAFMAHKMFSEDVRALNESIATHIEATNSLKNQNQILEIMSRTDGLTGIYNHTYIVTLLQHEIKLALKELKPLSIVLFDIDFFKVVNDTHGHVIGDHVLRSIASIINQNAPTISAGRYGGEEFLCILPGYSNNLALEYAEKVRRQIETTMFDKDLRITISAGIATWQGENASDFIKTADTLLYEAKHQGRNRICYET